MFRGLIVGVILGIILVGAAGYLYFATGNLEAAASSLVSGKFEILLYCFD